MTWIDNLLEAVDQSAVRAQANLFHDIFKGDEIFDIQVWLVHKLFCRRIKIYIKAGTLVVPQVLDQSGTKCSLSPESEQV